MTKETRHTPGPWEYDPNSDNVEAENTLFDTEIAGTIVTADGGHRFHVARIWSDVFGGTDEAQANAHLIAAAPELLEALVSIRAWVTDGGFEDTHEGVAEICGQARAAIAKAKGEQS